MSENKAKSAPKGRKQDSAVFPTAPPEVLLRIRKPLIIFTHILVFAASLMLSFLVIHNMQFKRAWFIDLYPTRKGVIKCDISREKFPFKNNFFDTVYMKCIIEHLQNIGCVIAEAKRVLKSNGEIILVIDNALYWAWALSGSNHLGGYEQKINRKKDKHYSILTEWHIKNHLIAKGFLIEKIEYIDYPKYTGSTFNNFIRKFVSNLYRLTPLWRAAHPRIKVVGKLKSKK